MSIYLIFVACRNSGQYSDDKCSDWKNSGNCKIQEVFMIAHCSMTCGFCIPCTKLKSQKLYKLWIDYYLISNYRIDFVDVRIDILNLLADAENTGKDCWYECGEKQGPCEWCGSMNLCCTQKIDWTDYSNGCDGTFGGRTTHQCTRNEYESKLDLLILILSHITDLWI